MQIFLQLRSYTKFLIFKRLSFEIFAPKGLTRVNRSFHAGDPKLYHENISSGIKGLLEDFETLYMFLRPLQILASCNQNRLLVHFGYYLNLDMTVNDVSSPCDPKISFQFVVSNSNRISDSRVEFEGTMGYLKYFSALIS